MKSRKEDTAIVKNLVRPILVGAGVGALCCLLVLLIMAAVLAAKDIPQAAVTPMAVVAGAFGCFIAGLVAAKIAGTKGLLFGAATGLLLYLIIMIAVFEVLKDIRSAYALVKLAVMIGCGAVGGIVGVNMKKK